MDKKTLWIIVAVVVIVGAVMWNNDGFKSSTPGSEVNSGSSASPAAGKAVVAGKKASPTPGASAAALLSYNEALKKYGDNRIQFGDGCQVTPATVTYKNGTSVLLDNRSSKSQKVTLDGKTYNLAGYGYQVVTLNSSSLPHQVKVNCGSAVNVMDLYLQAKIAQ